MTSFLWNCFYIISISLFIIAFFHTAISHFVASIHWRLEKLRLPFYSPPRTPFAFLRHIQSFLIEFFCLLLTGIFLPLSFLSFRPRTKGGTPILLVHGYSHNQTAWIFFRWILERMGVGPLYTLNLYPPFASIEHFAQLVDKKAQEIERKTGLKELILIGHSMGGLVSAYYAENISPPQKVRCIVTIGSPLHGTQMTAFGFGQCIFEMAPNSTFSQNLRKKIKDSSIPYHFVASRSDNIVIPWESALLDEEHKSSLVLQHHGHLRLLISPKVIRQVAIWVQ